MKLWKNAEPWLPRLLVLALIALWTVGCSESCPTGYQKTGEICSRPRQDDGGTGTNERGVSAAGENGQSTPGQTDLTAAGGQRSAPVVGAQASAGRANAAANSAGSGGASNSTMTSNASASAAGSAATSSASNGANMMSSATGPCAGQAGANVCDGTVLHKCDSTGNSASQETCMSAALCQVGIASGACAVCNPGSFHCEGAQLQRCGMDGQLSMADTCESAMLCNDQVGKCTPMLCDPGAKSCSSSGALKTCNADGSAFAGEQACGAGLCDTTNQRCNKCMPRAKQCEGNTVVECSADGQMQTRTDCAAKSDCAIPMCSGNGTCSSRNKTMGEKCGSGKFCDSSGGCTLDCVQDTDCRGSDQMCDKSNHCVMRPTCGNMRPDFGENCENTPDGWFANAPAGVCVNCQTTVKIYSLHCDAQGPAWPGSNWGCSNQGVPTVQCTPTNRAACITATGEGDCLLFGAAPNQAYFCALPCGSCPGGMICTHPPDGPPGGVCGWHEFQPW